MLQIDVFNLKYLLVDITKYLFDRIGEDLIDEVSKGTIRWGLVIH